MTDQPRIGARAVCQRCGRTVWLRKVGEAGSGEHRGENVLQWCARRGGKTRPILCPVSDGYPTTYHTPKGFQTLYYGVKA